MRLLLLAALLAAAPALAQDVPAASVVTTINVVPESPQVGQEATLSFDAPVETVLLTYRPNSAIPHTDTVRVGGFTSVKWTPDQAGVIAVGVPDGPSRSISVRFAVVPISGLFVLLVAGLILFGGAAWAMRKLLQGDGPKTIPEFRPDT